MYCGKCGKQIADGATMCASCGTTVDSAVATQQPPAYNQQNPYAQGPGAGVPAELKGKLNWGAFLLCPIWSIAHSTWIGLISLVPYVGWIMCIVMLIKGNEMAWQNRQFSSVEEFNKVQKIWTMWGVGVLVASIILGLVAGCMIAMLGSQASSM